jgi:hypothetical protein
MGREIPNEPMIDARGKIISRTLKQIVQLENERVSIQQLQKKGRRAATPARSSPDTSDYPDFEGFPSSPQAVQNPTPAEASCPLRQSTRLRRPTAWALNMLQPQPEPETSTLLPELEASESAGLETAGAETAAPEPSLPVHFKGRAARIAKKRAVSRISELASTLTIPKRRRK